MRAEINEKENQQETNPWNKASYLEKIYKIDKPQTNQEKKT